MKKISRDKARDYFSERVSTASKAMLDLADIMRRYPGEFTESDVRKAQAFLTSQVVATSQAMALALSTKVSTDFSFDMELPSHVAVHASFNAVQPAQVAPAQAASSTPAPVVQGGVPMREKAVGRLSRDAGGGVVKELVPLVPQRQAKQDAAALTAEHDKTGGIIDSGFIDDAA